MRYFFVDTPMLTGESVIIEGPDVRHIRNVLRLNRGDRIGLLDGRGNSFTARIESIMPDSITVEILHCRRTINEPTVKIIIAQAFLKDRKMDGLVRQMTEMGTAVWVPFCAERSVSRPDNRRLRSRLERWGKISHEALKQCRREHAMDIEPAENFDDVVRRAQSCDLRILFWEDERRLLAGREVVADGTRVNQVFAILGPEGGFSPAEVDAASANGFVTAGLGPRTLRSETAAVAAAALLQYLYGDLGKKT
jgi:16S rRNA (uracil1498-N3)-methyltransferase